MLQQPTAGAYASSTTQRNPGSRRLPPPEPLTHQDTQQTVELVFTISFGCLAFLLAALSPLLTFSLLGASTVALGLSLPYWNAQGNLSQSFEARPLDTREKILYSVAIPFASLLLGQFYPLFQVILCTGIGIALAYFFIDECILKSQEDLNQALRNATKALDETLVSKALALGADPLAPDLGVQAALSEISSDPRLTTEVQASVSPSIEASTRNTAIHLAIQDHENAEKILKLFYLQLKKPPMQASQVLRSFKEFFNLTNRANAFFWWECVKFFLQQHRSPTRRAYLFDATRNLLTGYVNTTKNIVLEFSHYLREQLAYTTLTANSAGEAPSKILENANMNAELKAHLREILKQINGAILEKFKIESEKPAFFTTFRQTGQAARPQHSRSTQVLATHAIGRSYAANHNAYPDLIAKSASTPVIFSSTSGNANSHNKLASGQNELRRILKPRLE